MALCVSADLSGVISIVTPQPADLSSCTMLVLSASELPAIQQSLDSVQAAEFFSYGFSAVMICYLAGFAVAAIRRPVRSAA